MKQLFVLALAALLLAGCSEKNVASMNAVIARQKVAVYHDDERGVTCWIFLGHQEGSISCLPDGVLGGE